MTKIREAIEILLDKGWVQGHGGSDATGYCLYGSLYRAHQQVTDGRLELDVAALWEAIVENYPSFNGSIPRFNDAPGRTLDQVIAVMEKATVRREESIDG